MNFKKWILLFIATTFSAAGAYAQCAAGGLGGGGSSQIINEIGLVAGPVVFKSDYLATSRVDLDNIGFGVGIVHYLNFSKGRDTYFNDHFKVRNEIAFQSTKFQHHGKTVGDGSANGEKLAAMHGETQVWEFGSNLEWYFLGISDFQSGYGSRFMPYLSLGIHFVHYSPEVTSDLGQGLGMDPEVTPHRYLTPTGETSYIQTQDENTYSISGSIGVRYKLGKRSDLQLDLRAIYYGSDDVDGINVNSDYNDAIAWVTLGYVYYLGM